MSSRIHLALTAAALISACQPLPRPFEDQNKEANGLLRLANPGGVMVLPIEGAPDPAAFAEAIAEQLRRLDVPATTRASTSDALRLGGRASTVPTDATRDQLEVSWRLGKVNGSLIGGRPGAWTVPSEAWRRADPRAMTAVAALAAPDLADMIEGDRPVTQTGPSLVIWGIDGAPGDGAVTLKAALERGLRRGGYRVLTDLGEESLVISGAVRLRPAGSGKQQVVITWSVLDPTGIELGQVSQENVIAAGLLDGPWGELARQIAGGALEGITEVLDQPRKKAGG